MMDKHAESRVYLYPGLISSTNHAIHTYIYNFFSFLAVRCFRVMLLCAHGSLSEPFSG